MIDSVYQGECWRIAMRKSLGVFGAVATALAVCALAFLANPNGSPSRAMRAGDQPSPMAQSASPPGRPSVRDDLRGNAAPPADIETMAARIETLQQQVTQLTLEDDASRRRFESLECRVGNLENRPQRPRRCP
jgi:hypothetical protein